MNTGKPRPTCCIEGCTDPHEAQGYCNRHYLRLKRTGTTELAAVTTEQRFWAKVRIADPHDCWPWTGYVDEQGYGRFSLGGRTGGMQMAHRVAWQLTHGPIPDGLEIDHVRARGCLHRNCVNPAHLEPVTPKVNSQRSSAGAVNRTRLLAMTHCKRGHEFTPENTAIKRGSGARRCRACDRDAARERRRAAA